MNWKLEPIERSWSRQSPFIKGIAGGVAILIAAAVLFSFVPRAWAAVEIPITDRITIEMGSLLSWAQFFLGAAGFWMIYRKASSAEAAAVQAVKQTDGVLEKVAALSKKEGKQEERADVAARKVVARSEAIADAEVVARIDVIKAPATGEVEPLAGKQPLPVADDKNTKAGERVAEATERMADAQGRAADALQDKK